MTKANVLQLGFGLLFLGVFGYGLFIFIGFDGVKAGIATQTLLVLVLLGGWVLSYFFRVFSGKMTFNEQRKRYRKEYDEITDIELQRKFDSMTEEEKIVLVKEIEGDSNNNG